MRTAGSLCGTNRISHCKDSPLPVDVDAEGKDMYEGEQGVYSLKRHGVFP